MGSTVGRVAAGVATGGISEAVNALSPDAPGAPQLPQFPDLTPEERQVLQQNQLTLQQFSDILSGEAATLGRNREILQGISGLFDESGNVNQAAIDDLRSRVDQRITARQQLGDISLGFLQDFFGSNSPEVQDIISLERERLLKALRGEGDLTEADKQDRQRQFDIMKEAAGRRGILIEGDSPEEATSTSTAGIRAISEFNKRFDLLKDQRNREEIAFGSTQSLNREQLSAQALSDAARVALSLTGFGDPAERLGFLNDAGTQSITSLTPALSQILSGYSQNVLNPLSTVRLGQFNQANNQALLNLQQDNAQFNADNAFISDLLRLGGTVVGASLGGGGGATLGQLQDLSKVPTVQFEAIG